LEVKKDLDPVEDPGRFDLLIDNTIEAHDAGDGGTTGAKAVTAGNHSVTELAGTPGTDLAEYASSTVCRDRTSGDEVAQGAGAGPLTVPVGAGDAVVCTVTNVRRACEGEFTRLAGVAEAWFEDQMRFDINIAWCHDGRVARLPRGEASVTTDSTLESTVFRDTLEAFDSITLRARNDHATVGVRLLAGGVVEVTAKGDFDVCLDPGELILQWITGRFKHLLQQKHWDTLSPSQKRAALDGIADCLSLPRALRPYQAFVLPELRAAIELIAEQWIAGGVKRGIVCIDTWRPEIVVNLYPSGTVVPSSAAQAQHFGERGWRSN
jgi:hypothetical protein